MMSYRIAKVKTHGIDPCCWQAQKRVWLFFWRPLCGATASATTQANEIQLHEYNKKRGDV
jgi:hypothetical protein